MTALLGGRYSLGDRVATGGMGSVFEATDTRLNRQVAVKLLREELAQDDKFVERFRREARAAAALSHPNIAGVFDYGVDEDRHFIVMELVAGRDLARLLREESPLPLERTVRIGTQIAEALGHAHEAGLVHRDVKPANVIVDKQDRVKVTDFGIARAQAESTLTATGTVLGSAHYLSPEQASAAPVSPASDIYSLGVLIYEMLTGTVPFTGDSPVAVAMRHISDDMPDPRALNHEVGAGMNAIVQRATAKRPEDRFPRAQDMADALRTTEHATDTGPPIDTAATRTAVMSGSAASATSVLEEAGPSGAGAQPWPFPDHPPSWDPRSIGRAVIAIFVVLGLIAAGLLALRLAQSDDRNRPTRQRQAVPPPEQESTPQSFPLPEVRDRNYEDARAVLEVEGLDVIREDVPSEDYPAEVVIDTEPAPGTRVEPGATVTLIVSTGPDEDDGDEDDEDTDKGPGSKGKGADEPPGQEKKEDDD